jgi:hypothetical protein
MANAKDAEKYRLAQAQVLIDAFTIARGRAPATMDELEEFVAKEEAAGRLSPGPIDPFKDVADSGANVVNREGLDLCDHLH